MTAVQTVLMPVGKPAATEETGPPNKRRTQCDQHKWDRHNLAVHSRLRRRKRLYGPIGSIAVARHPSDGFEARRHARTRQPRQPPPSNATSVRWCFERVGEDHQSRLYLRPLHHGSLGNYSIEPVRRTDPHRTMFSAGAAGPRPEGGLSHNWTSPSPETLLACPRHCWRVGMLHIASEYFPTLSVKLQRRLGSKNSRLDRTVEPGLRPAKASPSPPQLSERGRSCTM